MPTTQISFAQAEYEKKKKRTRREVFLEKMENVVPWSRLMQKKKKRRPPYMGAHYTCEAEQFALKAPCMNS